MADEPKDSGEPTPTTDKDHLVHPDGMNPHIVPKKVSDEEEPADDDA
ncbi:MAG TPA: hypothetical protein VGD53_18220 [Actinoallomurus sp.]|jgi:hypothetical protein